jgi:hypothetical protein
MMMPKPFQIPMAALLPKHDTNFLPAGKNIGVTHLTNGAFRLHPIEWMIGEAAGTIAALTIASATPPSVAAVQNDLAHAGVPLVWFDDLPVDHPAFAAIQLAAIRGQYPLGTDLHASPGSPVTRAEAAVALAARFGEKLDRDGAMKAAVSRGWMAVDHRNWFHPDLPFAWTDLREDKLPSPLPQGSLKPGPVSRAEFAVRLQETL